jgi:hypothetical protein
MISQCNVFLKRFTGRWVRAGPLVRVRYPSTFVPHNRIYERPTEQVLFLHEGTCSQKGEMPEEKRLALYEVGQAIRTLVMDHEVCPQAKPCAQYLADTSSCVRTSKQA